MAESGPRPIRFTISRESIWQGSLDALRGQAEINADLTRPAENVRARAGSALGGVNRAAHRDPESQRAKPSLDPDDKQDLQRFALLLTHFASSVDALYRENLHERRSPAVQVGQLHCIPL